MMRTIERNRAIRTAAGTLTCMEGLLWITWKGSGDFILAPGDSIEIPMGSHPVVEAIRGPGIMKTKPIDGREAP